MSYSMNPRKDTPIATLVPSLEGNDSVQLDMSPSFKKERLMPSYASTYVMAAALIFFATSAILPAASGRTSSLVATQNNSDTVTGQLYQLIVWSTLILLMLPKWRTIIQLGNRMRSMIVLSALAPISAIWSQNPMLSFRRGVFLCLGSVFAMYLVSEYRATDLAQIVIIAGLGTAALSIAAVIFVPAIGLDGPNGGVWQGIINSKNGCGQVFVFFLTPAVTFRSSTKIMQTARYLLIAMALLIIFMSNAKTAWIFAPGYVALIGLTAWMRRLRTQEALLAVTGLGVTIAGLIFLGSHIEPLLLELLGKDTQLTGRIPLWTAALVSFAKHPLLGYGYEAFWTGMRGESLSIFMQAHFEIYQAQNGFLEVGLELGLVGVFFFIVTLFVATRNALACFRRQHREGAYWYFGILVLTFAYSMDEAFIGLAHSLPWLLYVVACCGLTRETQQNPMRIPKRGACNFHAVAAEAI